MSKVNDLPEWTAQALVALGAVFLLISAYVMGVMVPNGLLAPNDFDANFYFEGDIQTFDLDVETGEGVFVDNVGSGSYDPTKAKEGGGATLNVVGKPDGDDYTLLTQNFSLTTNGIDGDGVWLGTISDTTDNPSLLNRKTYEVDGKQGTWTPTNLPETGKTYEFPNPVNSGYTDNFTCSDKRMLDGLEVMTCIAQSGEGEKMEFVPGEGSDLELLQETFESFNSLGSPGSAPMWFDYRAEYTVGTGIGGVVDRIFNVTVYMEVPTLLHLEDNFNFTTTYEGRVGGINTATLQTRYYDATGFRAGCVNTELSTETHINVLGYLRIFENEYDENGTMLPPNYGRQSSDGCWDSYIADNNNIENPDTDSFQELVNVTYNVGRTTLQYEDGYYDSDGDGDGFNFFSPTCGTVSTTDRNCWVPAANASWPNAMHNPHIQDYTFISETEVNGTLAFHFNAEETNIAGDSGSLYNENLGTGLVMDYYEDVWVDPVTGTVLDQKYSIQIFVPTVDDSRFHDERGSDDLVGADCDEGSGLSDCPDGVPDGASMATIIFNGAILRDIVANFTQEAQDEGASSAKRQALAQYYQGNEVIVLTLNGAYTDKTVDEQISGQIESVDALTFGSKTLPSILIGGALIALLAGFYVYYQTGGGAASLDGMADDEASSSMAVAEEESTEDEAADDTSDAEEDSSDADEESDSEDDDEGGGGGEENIHSSAQGGFG